MSKCFKGATLLDPSSETVVEGVSMLVENGRIQALGTAENTPVPDDVHIVDLRGKFVIPGQIDCHRIFRWHVPGGRWRGRMPQGWL